MGKVEQKLGQLELEVLKIIWRDQPCTVQDVFETIQQEKTCARTTILTVIQRLHKKSFLKRRKKGGVFHFSTTSKKGKTISKLIKQFVDSVLDGSAQPFVAYLAESKKLNTEQVEVLHEIVRDLENGTNKEK